MCEFDTPNFVYYSYVAVIILTLITGFSILLKDSKRPANRNAFYFVSIIALWTFDDLLQWTVHDPFWNMFFAKVSYMSDFIILFYLFFVYHFTYTKISLKKKFLFSIPYLVVSLLAYTPIAFKEFSFETCDYLSGPLLIILFLVDVVYMYWITKILLKYYHDPIIPLVDKQQTKILIFAGWFFIAWEIVYEIIGFIGSSNEITPHFIIGNLFFVSLIAFAIIKEDLFEFNMVPLDWLVVFVWTSIFAGFFFFATTPIAIILSAIAYAVLMILFFKMR